MCIADVTRSHRSPGFGSTSALVKRAFSTVLRERSSSVTRERAMPKLSNSSSMNADSGGPATIRLALPPLKTIRASGKRRARAAMAVMRSALSLIETMPRAADRPGSIAPPRMTMPSGGSPASFHGGKRCSRTSIDALPTGRTPKTSSQAEAAQQKPPAGAGIAGPQQREAARRQEERRDGTGPSASQVSWTG